MFVSKALSINNNGHLVIGGCDCVELAKKYGTPLYVMDEELIRKNCREFKQSLDKFYDGNGLVLYASKAFCSLSICKIIEQESLGFEVVSGGELYTAIKAEFPVGRIYFNGNNKTSNELEMAIDNNIGRIIVDNENELFTLDDIAEKKNKIAQVLLRITPGIEAHTHEFIKTGQIDSKFGFTLETGEAFDVISKFKKFKNINLVGLHCHIGSQIFDIEPFIEVARVMMNFIYELKQKLGTEIKELNLGGGFGIKYISEHNPVEYERYMEKVSLEIKKTVQNKSMLTPKVLIEPGRAIVGSTGITLYTVGSVKEIPNVRKYVTIDGGMIDNPRYILYQAEHEAVVANKVGEQKNERVTIAGRCCESGDLIGEDMELQKVETGDIIAVFSTGAYNYSMASNYNRIPRPPVVLVKDGKERLIIKRETYDDLIKNDIQYNEE